jgi:hypothetical protein
MQSGGDIAESEHQKDHRVELFRGHSALSAEQYGESDSRQHSSPMKYVPSAI